MGNKSIESAISANKRMGRDWYKIKENYNGFMCPICNAKLFLIENHMNGVRDGNIVYHCENHDDHTFWKNARESYFGTLRLNKNSSNTNFDYDAEYKLIDGKWIEIDKNYVPPYIEWDYSGWLYDDAFKSQAKWNETFFIKLNQANAEYHRSPANNGSTIIYLNEELFNHLINDYEYYNKENKKLGGHRTIRINNNLHNNEILVSSDYCPGIIIPVAIKNYSEKHLVKPDFKYIGVILRDSPITEENFRKEGQLIKDIFKNKKDFETGQLIGYYWCKYKEFIKLKVFDNCEV